MKIKIIIILVLSMVIMGCSPDKKGKEKNYYQLNINTTMDNFESLSNIGDDYKYPIFKEKSWCNKRMLKNESYVLKNKVNKSIFYVIRCDYTKLKNTDNIFLIDILKKYLNEDIKKYIGSLEKESQKLSFVNDIEYYDEYGRIKSQNSKYYAVYFQSHMIIPSIGEYKVPTIILVKFENYHDRDNIKKMFLQMKKWMVRMN